MGIINVGREIDNVRATRNRDPVVEPPTLEQRLNDAIPARDQIPQQLKDAAASGVRELINSTMMNVEKIDDANERERVALQLFTDMVSRCNANLSENVVLADVLRACARNENHTATSLVIQGAMDEIQYTRPNLYNEFEAAKLPFGKSGVRN
jgi:hypothetical protein